MRHSYVCRRGLYVIYIVMLQTSLFRLSRHLGNSNKFGQMHELINDNYSDIKLYIEKALNFLLIEKNQQLNACSTISRGAASLSI